MNWLRDYMLPVQGSVYAGKVDDLYMFLIWLSAFFFFLVAGIIAWCVINYRRRPGRKSAHITDHLGLELTWSIVPLILVTGVFFWGVSGYMEASVAPGDALEITVTARKWNWAFEYPDGSRTASEIHVPVGKPVKFLLMSEDVLHDFFVPAMRVKHDVLPNRYTEVWFTPSIKSPIGADGKAVPFLITCAEYCGKGHSDMQAKLFVDDDVTYKKWVEEGGDEWKSMTPAAFGKLLWESKGCATCHSIDGSPVAGGGPSWKGIYSTMQPMSDGKAFMADENYIRESIMVPGAKIVKGYDNIMPSFQGLLRDREVNALIAFMKTLK